MYAKKEEESLADSSSEDRYSVGTSYAARVVIIRPLP
jgi:hypothetical protein